MPTFNCWLQLCSAITGTGGIRLQQTRPSLTYNKTLAFSVWEVDLIVLKSWNREVYWAVLRTQRASNIAWLCSAQSTHRELWDYFRDAASRRCSATATGQQRAGRLPPEICPPSASFSRLTPTINHLRKPQNRQRNGERKRVSKNLNKSSSADEWAQPSTEPLSTDFGALCFSSGMLLEQSRHLPWQSSSPCEFGPTILKDCALSALRTVTLLIKAGSMDTKEFPLHWLKLGAPSRCPQP